MTVRIAMWSGPRSLSTALMRSFEARGDCRVTDEPLYAFYLDRTGLDHPMRDAVIASQPTDWRVVADTLVGPCDEPVWYQKHMAHHLLPEVDRGWLAGLRHAFLIRDPAAIAASYARSRASYTAADLGVVQLHEIWGWVRRELGQDPPVIDQEALLADPATTLRRLCGALEVPFTPAMLGWPAGRRATDGVWGAWWYEAVERSTGFGGPSAPAVPPPEAASVLHDVHDAWTELRALGKVQNSS